MFAFSSAFGRVTMEVPLSKAHL